MRTPQTIIQELKNVTHWSQPNIKYNETMALLNELEAALNSQPTTKKPEPVVVEAVVEEPVEVKATRKTTKK